MCYNRYYFIFQCSEHKVYCGRLFVCGQKYVSNFNHSCTYCQVSFPNVFNHFLIFLCISKFSNFYTYCIFLNELLNNYKVVKTCLCKSARGKLCRQMLMYQSCNELHTNVFITHYTVIYNNTNIVDIITLITKEMLKM